jgi:O-methyltransferase
MIKSLLRNLQHALIRVKGIQNRAGHAFWMAEFLSWRDKHPSPKVLGKTYAERLKLHDYVAEFERLDSVLDYLEFGVFQGESIKSWLKRNTNPDSRFVGFDSFEGLPENWRGDSPQGTFATGGTPPQVDDPRCSFEVGWFQRTLPSFLQKFTRRGRMLVHLDADLYSSTLYVLTSLAPLLKKDDILIFDEFRDVEHEFRAWMDFLSAYPTDYVVVGTIGDYGKLAVRLTTDVGIANLNKS